MNIKTLREHAPGWTWSAERWGMGWQYRGERDGETVRVYAVAVLCGPTEDDYSTQWRVDDGRMRGRNAWGWIADEQAATACRMIGKAGRR